MSIEKTKQKINTLIYDYAHCIDDDRLEEWPNFFTENCFYQIISRVDYDLDMPVGVITCTTKGMLTDRIVSLRNANIYEPHVYRHLISGVVVQNENKGVWDVKSSYTVIRTMDEGETTIFSTGKYLDKIIFENKEAKFQKRICVFDSRRMDTLLVIPI